MSSPVNKVELSPKYATQAYIPMPIPEMHTLQWETYRQVDTVASMRYMPSQNA